MDYLKVLLSTLSSIIVLFLLTKIMGNKQLSQLNMFDYITGITIGSIAAEMATQIEDPIKPLISMIVYGVLAFLISWVSSKSEKFRKIFAGRTILLYDNGKIYKENFKKARIDLSDFLTICRVSGYFNLNQIQTAILEHNGNVSFLPVSGQRPVTPNDMSLNPEQDFVVTDVILDGKIMSKNLKLIGKSEEWLDKQLHAQGFHSASDIILATCDKNDNVLIYPMINEKYNPDLFE